ncbi:Flagellar motor rotation protein MotB [hydrothermal vent metagenome]|uniref:Flagellar motor rotation protein MotB n=1 Tax=hydrothermal vent metagenome TaxID=652676 RepID=A0A3B0S943_9ZZZZ
MNGERPIIIKKVIKVSGGHHGGAWKVAYADFVTAMMAFFLLMWLINMTSPEQKMGVADYFAPASISESKSGSGGILGGKKMGEEGAKSSGADGRKSTKPKPTTDTEKAAKSGSDGKKDSAAEISESALDEALSRREEMAFQSAAESLRQAMQDLPELAELSKSLMVDQTPEGMRIQIVDQEGLSMFMPGSITPRPRTVTLLRSVAKIINRLPNRITISGHTDSAISQEDDGVNWTLSMGRANSARAVLREGNVVGSRIFSVIGKAGSEPLYPDDPYMAGNRRISIVLLREAPPLPPGHSL